MDTLKKATEIPLKTFSIDGGVSNNGLICETIATLTRQPLRRPVDIDASARGAAFFAGIGAGIWTQYTLPEIVLKDTVEPVWEESENLVEEYKHWEDSIKRTLKWSELEFDDTEDADCVNPNMI
mgnify:CR=1 FL=1